MLAKVAPPTNDFHALARYLVHGKAGRPHPDRVAWVFAQNLPTDDPELAATYMAETAQMSARTKNAAYHLMIAWHQRERPTPELMQVIARQTLELAGLGEHQALIMGHGDKPHPHLHVLLNRVHPDTGRAWKTNHDFACFDRIMRQLASAHSCEYAPAHAFNPELTDVLPSKPDSPATYAAKRGAPTRRLKWSKASSRAFGAHLSEDITQASTPDDIAMLLEEHGLAIKAKGKGVVVGNVESYATLSSLNLTDSANELMRSVVTAEPHRKRRVFDVDGVDIVRAFVGMGLINKSAIAKAVQDRIIERQQERSRNIARRTTMLTPAVSVKRPTKPRKCNTPLPRASRSLMYTNTSGTIAECQHRTQPSTNCTSARPINSRATIT